MTDENHPAEEGTSPHRRRHHAIWGREIPLQNRHFTGRERELGDLRKRLTEGTTAVVEHPPQPLYGLGGVGKTELAAEYAHRYRDHYDLVWWVRAEQEDMIINSLLALGLRLDLPKFSAAQRDYSASLVLEALNEGNPVSDWLLIFDNAEPAVVSDYIPRGPGHVIITSRDREWRRAIRAEGVEVGEFALSESVEFLRKRVPQLQIVQPGTATFSDASAVAAANEERQAAAEELARELGNLPIAAEHAAAYLLETGSSVTDYLVEFRRDAHQLLNSNVDILYPDIVAATWSVSKQRMSAEANALFELLAFFSPEPISEELLVQPTAADELVAPLTTVLDDRLHFRKAARELWRFSLIRIDGVRNIVQMHRVVQAVTAGKLEHDDRERARLLRAVAHALLAASDPGSPDRDDSEPLYERSRQHILPSGAPESDNPRVRNLIINQVRRLMLRGGYSESLRLGETTLDRWREKFGPNDRLTLALAIQVGFALRNSGRHQEGFDLNADTLGRLRIYGETDPLYLNCAVAHARGMMLYGHYQEALELNLELLPFFESEIRPDHTDTLYLRNNIAVNLRCLGRFDEALEYDQITLAERERVLGYLEDATLSSKMAVSRDLRRLGRLEEAADLMREVNEALEHKNEPWNRFRLAMLAELAVCLRRIGLYQDAANLSEDALRRHCEILGARHRQTLLAATNLVNDRRLVDDLPGAQTLGEQVLKDWTEVIGPEHPNTMAALGNLAIVLRERSNLRRALDLNEQALAGFRRLLGDDHPSTLIVMNNLASDLALLGDVRRAREMGEIAYARSREVRGEDHICTLATAVNLSIDRRAEGDETEASTLYETAMAAYRETLTAQHPQVRRAAQGGRVNLDLEPMHT